MNGISYSLNNVIQKLGYNKSKNLYCFSDLNNCKDLSFHDRKVLKEIKPCAFFVIDSRPKVLFFDYLSDNSTKQELYKKIWNAQIPIIIYNDHDGIKVFNGNSMDLSDIDNLELNMIVKENHGDYNDMSPFSYWNITNEKFLRDYQVVFSKDTLNEIMLSNIKCATDKLKNDYNVGFATKLILRIIFIRFLIDRGISIGYKEFSGDVSYDQEVLLRVVKDKYELYSLFSYLKDKFNGNLFELGDELKDSSLTDGVFSVLEVFLSGKEEMGSGQMSFFPLYDFNIIPIELISNIYEILLGRKVQDSDKAFYTPEYLADYIVKDTVGTLLSVQPECRVLDPSCGSGIFLVQTLKQIISKNVDDDGYIKDNQKLCGLVTNNIYGVDLNSEAIDITIFSLYLTLFDYKDPKSLDGFRLPDLKEKNLWVSDFFDEKKLESLYSIKFHCILGNPPWGSVKEGLHLKYCKKNKIPFQRQEISRSFIARVKDFSDLDTICALVIPSKLLYNQKLPSVEFRKGLLKKTKILKLVEMSSVRKLLFRKADAPASILIYKFLSEDCLNHNMIHISLQPNMFFKLYHIIAIEKNDIKKIQQRILFENDWVWKALVYGTSWDIDNIRMLKKKYPSLKNMFTENNLQTASGISENPAKFNAECYKGRTIIEATAIDSFYFDINQSSIFNKDKIYRIGKTEVYEPPYCLMRKGPDVQTYRLRAVYSEADVIFKEAISVIKGNIDQRDILLNITGLLNSSLYAYLNLMLGSSMGIEREQVFMNEVYQFPYVYDEKISLKVEEIQNINSSSLINGLIADTSQEMKVLDEIVLKKFELKDDPFIDYALNVRIPMLNGRRLTFDEVTIAQLKEYSSIFFDYWQDIMSKQNKFISIVLYPKILNKFTVFELKVLENKPIEKITIMNYVDNNKEILSRFLIHRINEQFYELKDVIYFEEESFFIIKSCEAKNWHKAMAYIDNTDAIDCILSNNREDE